MSFKQKHPSDSLAYLAGVGIIDKESKKFVRIVSHDEYAAWKNLDGKITDIHYSDGTSEPIKPEHENIFPYA